MNKAILDDITAAPEQHGLAGFLSLREDYAKYPFPAAFTNIQLLLPHLQKLAPDQIRLLDWTVFYSRRLALTPEETQILISDDIGALVGAIDAGGLLAYGRGHLLNTTDTGKRPYDDFDFTPNCFSWCLWMTHEDAQNGARTPKHRDAMMRAHRWFGNDFRIVKLRSAIVRNKTGKEQLSFERLTLRH